MNLHFGCFDHVVPGWINTDITEHIFVARVPGAARVLHALGRMTDERYRQHREGLFRRVTYLDLTKRFRWPDATFDNAFSAHVLEHLHPAAARNCVAEVYRVLRPGGTLRISVPDLDLAVSGYDCRNPVPFLQLVYNVTESQRDTRHQHHWMYTEHSLRQLLSEVGFPESRRCGFREGRCPDLDLLDDRPEISLFVEATK